MEWKNFGSIVAIVVMVALAAIHQKEGTKSSEFESWKEEHNVKFESQFEEVYRERVFMENLAKINAHNAKTDKTYEMGVNKFTAMTQDEFIQKYLGTIVPSNNEAKVNEQVTVNMGDIDWTTQGAVTGIKNQGNCGSCWAFSATGGLEGLSKIAYGTLQSFSESQLVDCSGKYGNQGCNGGLMDNAFKFVRDNGITTEQAYPYVPKQNSCKATTGDFKISGFTDIKDCNTLVSSLSGRPISVAVDASNWSSYKSGVFSNCGTRLNHGVLLVGISGTTYKIKNSWGASWGQSGFIRLASGNTCGICNVASYPNK